MQRRDIFAYEGSDESHTNERSTAERADGQCPACDGRVVTERHEAYCRTCGLVVRDGELHEGPTSAGRKQRSGGGTEWGREGLQTLRVDHGLGTRMDLGTDGRGNAITGARRRRLRRLRRQHRRMASRARRLNEALRDIETIGGNLALPMHVQADAGRLVRAAREARLPGGRMAWEALAGGAVLLEARRDTRDWGCSPERVARYAKASHERTAAAARKLRTELGLVDSHPPARERVVDRVFGALGSEGLDARTLLDGARVARALVEIADREPIGPGTTRVTIGAAAVDRALRLMNAHPWSYARVAEAAGTIVATSENRIGRYSRRLGEEVEQRYGGRAPAAILQGETGRSSVVDGLAE